MFRHINEILGDVMTDPSESLEQEAAFRRGYDHGYQLAIDHLQAFMGKEAPIEALENFMIDFANKDLTAWRRRAREGFEVPPRWLSDEVTP